MAHKPSLRLRRWLLALMVICLASVGGLYGAGHEVSATAQSREAAGLLRLAALPPVAAAVSSCPPDPCVFGKDVGQDFFVQVVERLSDVPLNGFAVDALLAWEPWENTEACWNPLATCRLMSEICYAFPPACVQSYQDQEMGIQATTETLSLSYYNAIRSMLRLEVFDREALRTALEKWGTCAGTYCDPLLNAWQDLWDAYVGTCCGCLPAGCCSAADIAHTSDLASAWTDAGALSTAPLPLSTTSSICQTTGSGAPFPIEEEEMESGVPDEPDLVDIDLSSAADVPELEPTEDLPANVEPADSLESRIGLAQWEAVEPQRTPPTSANYSIVKSVFGSGGGKKTSTNYVMNSTQGQSTDLSRRTSSSYVLLPGYWGVSIPHSFEYRVYLPVILRED